MVEINKKYQELLTKRFSSFGLSKKKITIDWVDNYINGIAYEINSTKMYQSFVDNTDEHDNAITLNDDQLLYTYS